MGARDLIWAALICLGLNYYLHTRPLGEARKFVEKESLEGFRRAFMGHKFVTGELVTPQSGARVLDDKTRAMVQVRRLNVKAEQLAWDGKHAEFVVHHLIKIEDGTTEGRDVGQQVHVALEKDGSDWQYSTFQVLGQAAPGDTTGNPWETALATAASF